MNSIQQQINLIRQKIQYTSSQSSYKQQVKLVAVTKTHPVDTLSEAYNCGLKAFGENRVQELTAKLEHLPKDIEWHLIGALQTNKVKNVLPYVKLIHSLDRVSLADEIDKRAANLDLVANTLIEVNVAKENNKHGIYPEEVSDFVHYLSSKKNINILGLMTVAPYAENPEEIRWVFRDLRNLFLNIKKHEIANVDMQWLSMGMTNDYEIAIDEGANLVRIGSGIFGSR